MKIVLNGEVHETSAATLTALLDELGLSDSRVATAVNGDFVPIPERAAWALEGGEEIEVVAPMQGG